MCLMCIEIFNERMTVSEARRALPELIDTARTHEDLEHYKKLQNSSDDEMLELIKKLTENK